MLRFAYAFIALIIYYACSAALCCLSDNIYDYYNVSQGKITIPSMDDGEEFQLTDVRRPTALSVPQSSVLLQ